MQALGSGIGNVLKRNENQIRNDDLNFDELGMIDFNGFV